MQTAQVLHFVCINCRAGGGDGLTGWATLALAVVTTGLAIATALSVRQGKKATSAAVEATQAAIKEAKATENLVAQSAEQLRRTSLPILLPVNVSSTTVERNGPVESTIAARIENVGTGPALNIVMDVVLRDGDRSMFGGETRRPVVSAGRVDALSIKYGQSIPSAYVVRLSFKDSFGARYLTSCQMNGPRMSDLTMVAVDSAGNRIETIVD